MKKYLSLIFAILILISALLIMTACNNDSVTNGNADETSISATSQKATAPPGSKVVGEGETSFVFSVIDAEGQETYFDVYTDKTTVGEALLDCGLIAGDQRDYGLYVKTVNGITLDYDKDGKYWAFYVNGGYAATGVDLTQITAGEAYCFKAE